MKINSLYIFFLALSLLAGCTKSEEAELFHIKNARLSIAVKIAGKTGSSTKAVDGDIHALQGETDINNLSVLIFDYAGNRTGYKWESLESARGTATINNVETQTGQARIVIVSNVPENAFSSVRTYGEFQNQYARLATQARTNLTMSSPLISTNDALSEGDNYIGFSTMENVDGMNEPVYITRIAARVDLSSVEAHFAGTALAGRQVRVDAISLIEVKEASRYFSEAHWGEVEMPGNFMETIGFNNVNAYVSENSPYRPTESAYVMENAASEKATCLLIRATLLENDEYREETHDYIVRINENGIKNGYDHNFIKRNNVYALNVTFTEESFTNIPKAEPDPDPVPDPVPDPDPDPDPDPVPPTPDEPTKISVNVWIYEWGEVVQNPVFD
ncbi:fimbrial protein [uncultured Parabacteroides sp.]|uniref:fimbrial protein n=1 Tax=uncultured Parabacteroides sp. TaxID=512312 RepID=UPI0026151D8B|nr:fimbrial protein [uncultured Parabacteroides sp.]